MIACACREIIMGKQSNIGPIDPHFSGIPAHGVKQEFERAIKEVTEDPNTIPIWQTIIGKYHPTFIGECQNVITMSEEIATSWLSNNMFYGDPSAEDKVAHIVDCLGSHEDTKTHARHIHIDEARNDIGLKISSLEDDFDDDLQDLILTIHHAFMHTFSNSNAIKIVENHNGNAIIYQYNPRVRN